MDPAPRITAGRRRDDRGSTAAEPNELEVMDMSNRIAALTAAWMAVGVSACVPAPDLTAVQAERDKPVQRSDNFQAAASNGRQLVSAGGGGVLVTSADGGKTWLREQLPSPSSVVAMAACPDGGFAALDFYRKVWIGDAGGRNWQPQGIDGDFNPIDIACDPNNRLWVVGSYSTVLVSEDRGKTWAAQPPGEDAILTAVQFVDAEHGYIAGEFGTLLVTVDGGASWTKQAGLPAEFYPYAMSFIDAKTGWVSGLAGSVLHTVDGGASWTEQANASAAPIYALLAVGGTLFGVGGSGKVLKLDGEAWTALEAAPRFPADLAAAAALEPQALLVAGGAGALSVVELAAKAVSGTAPVIAAIKPEGQP